MFISFPPSVQHKALTDSYRSWPWPLLLTETRVSGIAGEG